MAKCKVSHEIQQLLKDNRVSGKATLPAFAFPGGYPIGYVTGECAVLCSGCAQDSLGDSIPSFVPNAYFIDHSDEGAMCASEQAGSSIRCDECSEFIDYVLR